MRFRRIHQDVIFHSHPNALCDHQHFPYAKDELIFKESFHDCYAKIYKSSHEYENFIKLKKHPAGVSYHTSTKALLCKSITPVNGTCQHLHTLLNKRVATLSPFKIQLHPMVFNGKTLNECGGAHHRNYVYFHLFSIS